MTASDFRNHDFPDLDLKVMIDMRPRVGANERPYHEDQITYRRHILQSGLTHPSIDLAILRDLQAIDPLLSAWFNADKGGIQIDRLVREYGAHVCIAIVPIKAFDRALVEQFREGDMQRSGNSGLERVTRIREAARLRREANQRDADNRLLGKIDNMSDSQVKKFVEVEKAIQTGEKVTLHGDDERFVDRAAANTREVEAAGGKVTDDRMAENPGQNPLLHHREGQGAHIRQGGH